MAVYDFIYFSLLTYFRKFNFTCESAHYFSVIFLSFTEQLLIFGFFISANDLWGLALFEELKIKSVFGYSMMTLIIYLVLPLLIVLNSIRYILGGYWKALDDRYACFSHEKLRSYFIFSSVFIVFCYALVVFLVLQAK